jgi:hypothetical protein
MQGMTDEAQEKRTGRITLEEGNPEDVNLMLDFMYGGDAYNIYIDTGRRTSHSLCRVAELYALADMYGVDDFKTELAQNFVRITTALKFDEKLSVKRLRQCASIHLR